MQAAANVKETAILMNGEMVRATLREDDPKTQTRRVFKQAVGPSLSVECDDQGVAELSWLYGDGPGHEVHERIERVPCPYGTPGDRLWVRETFFAFGRWETRFSERKGRDEWHFVDMTLECDRAYQYAADNPDVPLAKDRGVYPGWWRRPSIHMPRAASRITLGVTGVRVERLNRISSDDCFAEGIDPEGADYNEGENYANAGSPVPPERWAFAALWQSTGGDWEDNPWVWVVEFRRAI
jgi:hypothetical protein